MRISHIAPSDDDLAFFITFEDGERYTIDLREFAFGADEESISNKVKHVWAGDFRGRPTFAYQFAKMLQDQPLRKHTTKQYRVGLRNLFRFFDTDEAAGGETVAELSDVADAHGEAFSIWLGPDRQSSYRAAKAVIDAMRAFHKMPKLAWPPRERDWDRDIHEDALSPESARALYQIAKSECRDIKHMLKEGRRLAELGSIAGNFKRDAEHWSKAENRAHLVAVATSARLLDKTELEQLGYYRILHKFPGPGPTYLAPMIGLRSELGWFAALRWFHPAFHDMAILLWLFVIGTGWNLSTALALDISEDDKWCLRHPTNAKFVVLHSYKARSKRRQIAFSMTAPEFHPHQIIRYVIEITKALRANVQHELNQVIASHNAKPTPALAARIAHLKRIVRSPWLYHVPNNIGTVSAISHGKDLGPIIREAARRQGKLKNFPDLSKVIISDPRDTWIQYAYVQSGYHVLIGQLAGFHEKASTTKHYLKSMQYRARSEKAVRRFQDTLVSEIVAGRIVDPTRLKMLLDYGVVTPQQQERLLDYRFRTRLGTACLDPYAPPRDVAPDHIAGSLCRIQRCLDCPHCVIFAESLTGLTRAYAELDHIKRTIPLAAWVSSSFADELASISNALKLFSPEDVRERIDHWASKLRSGEINAHDTYPAY